MMSLCFSGCSITWGDDLENRLQDRFTKSYPNIAERGISNDMMVMKTIEYIDRTPNVDFVVAQFTVPRRSTYYDGKWKSITPWTKNVESKVYCIGGIVVKSVEEKSTSCNVSNTIVSSLVDLT